MMKDKNDKKLTMEDMTKSNGENIESVVPFDDGESINDKVSLIAIQELLNLDKLKTISRIKFEQVTVITKLYLFTDIFDIPFTSDLAELILQLQISTNGLGRKELVSLVQQRDFSTDTQGKKLTSKTIFK